MRFPLAPTPPHRRMCAVESWLPSLDERVEMFLEAVHGAEHEYTAQARAAAREHILSAMASEPGRGAGLDLSAGGPTRACAAGGGGAICRARA